MSLKFGIPSPSVSTGVVNVPFSTASGIASPSLSTSLKSGMPSPSVSAGVVPAPFSIASLMPSPSLSKSK